LVLFLIVVLYAAAEIKTRIVRQLYIYL
jgi:hypothetical protein